MASFRGFLRRLHPRGQVVKVILTGLLFVTISFISMVFLVGVTENYPYNMYKGFPLTVYDNAYNIKPNQSECSDSKVVIVIHSAVTNFNKRATIRSTWANSALLRQFKMKLVFFLGLPVNKDIQVLVDAESIENKDVVQGNFIDSYTNITHKAVLWLRWVTENCPKVETVLKLDDDVFVNLFRFHDYLSMFESSKRIVWCEVLKVGEQRIQRKAGLKWRVADYELKGLKYYPLPLCRGYFVVMTKECVTAMYTAAKETPFFWIDDYYVFGTLANTTGAQLSSLQYLAPEEQAVDCFASKSSACRLMGVLLDSYSAMETLWKNTIRQQNLIS